MQDCYTCLCQQAWRDITNRIEQALRALEKVSPPNRSQMDDVKSHGESVGEVAPKLPKVE